MLKFIIITLIIIGIVVAGFAIKMFVKKDSEFKKLNRGISRALRFLEKEQRVDGSWLPLWFGNQMTSDKTNPVYGTARVAVYLQDAIGGMSHDNPIHGRIEPMLACAVSFLAGEQNEDGSWGAGRGVQGSMEETALALSALIVTSPDRCKDGFAWLDHEFQEKGLPAKPIGLYFASLWYSERMYPMVYYLEALRRAGKY